MLRVLTICFGVFCATATISQTPNRVGTAVVDGKTVQLFGDQTWAFAEDEQTPAGCQRITAQLRLCGQMAGAQRNPNTPAGITAQFIINGATYAQATVETIGTNQGLNPTNLRRALIANAANVANLRPEDLEILESGDTAVAEQPAVFIVYSMTVDGLQVVFANTAVMAPNNLYQLMTYIIDGESYDDAHRTLHETYIASIEIGDPQ